MEFGPIASTYFKGFADPRPHGVIHNNVSLGTPFDQWPEEVRQYYRYDPELAKQLLAEAGYPDGFKTTLDHFERYDANWPELAIGYWAEIGVEVEMTVHDTAAFIAAQAEHTTEGLAAMTWQSRNAQWTFPGYQPWRFVDRWHRKQPACD